MLKSGVEFTIWVSAYTPRFGDWAIGYERGEEDKFAAVPEAVDVVMTHGPPRGILDQVPSRTRPGEVGCPAEGD